MDDLVRYAVTDRVATLTMNRPKKRNALSAELITALKRALDRAKADDAVRVVVLTGAGSAFSAGADLASLRALQEATPQENRADSRHLADLFKRIYRFPKPVVGNVNGHAIGGGCGLAVACDLAFASTEAKLGFTEVRLGFVPAIVMVFVQRKLREAVARDLLLRGRLVDGEEAARLGLVTRALPPEELEGETTKVAREITTETSGSACALTKEMLASVPGMGLDEALTYATEMNALARSTEDCQAGIQAFLDKEDPPWKQEAVWERKKERRKGTEERREEGGEEGGEEEAH